MKKETSELIFLKIIVLSYLIQTTKIDMKNALKNWRTTIIGALLACLYLIQKAYHDNGMDISQLDYFDLGISSLIIIGGAISKDASVTGALKAILLFVGLTLADAATAQDNPKCIYIPAAGANGSLQINSNGIMCSTPALQRTDSGSIYIFSGKAPDSDLSSIIKYLDSTNIAFSKGAATFAAIDTLSGSQSLFSVKAAGILAGSKNDKDTSANYYYFLIDSNEVKYGNKYGSVTLTESLQYLQARNATDSSTGNTVLLSFDIKFVASVEKQYDIYLTDDGTSTGNKLFDAHKTIYAYATNILDTDTFSVAPIVKVTDATNKVTVNVRRSAGARGTGNVYIKIYATKRS